jgi:hypothetical protein
VRARAPLTPRLRSIAHLCVVLKFRQKDVAARFGMKAAQIQAACTRYAAELVERERRAALELAKKQAA